jgi:hypothetical protein
MHGKYEKFIHFASFEAFMEVMFQVELFCVVTPCGVVVGYQYFRRRQYGTLKGWYPNTILQDITIQNTSNLYSMLVERSERKIQFGRPRHRWE